MAASIMTLSGVSVSASIKATATNVEAAEITNAVQTVNSVAGFTLSAGFAPWSAVADCIMQRTYTIAAAASEDIDLSSAWVDAFGDAVAYLRIKALMVKNASVTANTDTELRIGASGGNEWIAWCGAVGDYVRVFHGGFFAIGSPGDADNDGYVVGPGATDLLRINNAGADEAIAIVTVLGVTGS